MSSVSNSATATTTATTNTPGAGISDAQKINNLHTASHLVAAQMGVDPANLTYEQRIQYDKALAVVITKYPERFTEQAVRNAQDSLKKNFTPLDNTGFDVGAFGGALVDNAVVIGNKLGGVGQNALDALSNVSTVLKWGLPIAALFFLYLYTKKKAA